jgi:hypothetical protein
MGGNNMGHYASEMGYGEPETPVTRKTVDQFGTRLPYKQEDGCGKCSKINVCKFADQAINCHSEASKNIPQELKEFVSFSFKCKHFSSVPQEGLR